MADSDLRESDTQGVTGETRLPPAASLDAFATRLAGSKLWANRLVYGTLLVAVSVGATFLASPGLYSQKIPELRNEDVGKPFRGASLAGFKASRDYEVLDETRTASGRDEARARVQPVFDYDPSVQSSVGRSIDDAFSEMQEVVEEYQIEHYLKGDGKAGEDPAAANAAKKRGPETKEEGAELAARLRDARKRVEGHIYLTDSDDFEALVQNRFSAEAQTAAQRLVTLAYGAKLVTSRDELSRVDQSGITVRILGGTSEHHLDTRQLTNDQRGSGVADLREVSEALDRYAAVPGNLMPDTPAALRRAVLRLVKRQLRANLTINLAETEARRRAAYEAAKPMVVSIKKGQKVIGDGELITQTHLLVVQKMREQTDELDMLQLQVGGAGVVAVVTVALWLFLRAVGRFRPSRKDALFMGMLLLGLLGLMHLWVTIADAVHDRYPQMPIEALYFCFPLAAGAMLVRFVLSEELALFFALVFSCLCGVMIGNSLSFATFALVTSLVASDRIRYAKDRTGIFRAGVWTGAVGALLVVFLQLAEGRGLWGDTLIGALFALLAGSFAVPTLVMALTPLTEAAFGYASDIKLLELANLNHPALKELIVQAPGTYHHSIIMGSLVEAAAEAIGANPLLARSCAYYHDIGKGRNPLYFGENQKGENRHDQLAPAMSAVIIKRHVTEGIEMARQYKLPRRVAAAIPEHHGTRLVGFFFHKAKKEQEGKEGPVVLDESVYRYAGPKPQSRETALVMIADAVEAASRSMPEPTSSNLHALVQKLINVIFSEGQLDECDLTLKDLNVISNSFVRTLEGIYHARPSYPAAAVGGPSLKPALTLARNAPAESAPAKKSGS
ncbi:MAG: HDIG domain-containing protein [Archangiaceae bacterium]|nr:HDIG domain-containing protein [Archangiaceae bacterium]